MTDAELTSLAATHDIISLGMLADDVRRRRHGTRTTFVRVADVPADVGAPVARPAAAGELRIVGVAGEPRRGGRTGRAKSRPPPTGAAVSAFSLADLEQLAARESVTLRALLEELRAAGLELVAEAPFDRLQNARRSIEEVNIAGLALARLTVHQAAVRGSDAAAQGGRRAAARRRASSAPSRRCRAASTRPCRRPATTT